MDSGPKAWKNKVPLWTDKATAAVAKILRGDFKVFEWGAGASTIWLAKRVGELTSIEHDQKWYDLVDLALAEEVLTHVRLAFYSIKDENYCKVIESYGDGYFDFICIDGRRRVDCIMAAISKVRSGGHLLVDDSQRTKYLPGIVTLRGWERIDYPFRKRTTSIFRKPQ